MKDQEWQGFEPPRETSKLWTPSVQSRQNLLWELMIPYNELVDKPENKEEMEAVAKYARRLLWDPLGIDFIPGRSGEMRGATQRQNDMSRILKAAGYYAKPGSGWQG